MPILTKRIITDLAGTSPYLVRWSFWLPAGWSIKLHQIVRPDDDRCVHDHPWWMLRIIVWGGYWERRGEVHRLVHLKPWRLWAPWRVYYCPPSFRHRITELPRGSSWTLVLCGPRTRKWGFYTRDGWKHWKEFVNAARSNRVLWCDDGRVLDGAAGEANQPLTEKVDHPPHYNQGPIEIIDLIDGFGLGFHLGNVVKYVLRSPHKGAEIEDLKKARWYLDRFIQKQEKEISDGNSNPHP